jgi:hypothetical protein
MPKSEKVQACGHRADPSEGDGPVRSSPISISDTVSIGIRRKSSCKSRTDGQCILFGPTTPWAPPTSVPYHLITTLGTVSRDLVGQPEASGGSMTLLLAMIGVLGARYRRDRSRLATGCGSDIRVLVLGHDRSIAT